MTASLLILAARTSLDIIHTAVIAVAILANVVVVTAAFIWATNRSDERYHRLELEKLDRAEGAAKEGRA